MRRDARSSCLEHLGCAPGETRTPDPQIRSLGARVPPSPITSQRASWHWRLPASPSLRVPLNPTRSQGPWPQRGHKIPPGLGGGGTRPSWRPCGPVPQAVSAGACGVWGSVPPDLISTLWGRCRTDWYRQATLYISLWRGFGRRLGRELKPRRACNVAEFDCGSPPAPLVCVPSPQVLCVAVRSVLPFGFSPASASRRRVRRFARGGLVPVPANARPRRVHPTPPGAQ